MRCLVLAKTLRRKGALVTFSCLPLPGDMTDYIEQQGFVVHKLTPPLQIVEPENNADYQTWLQRSQKEDAEDFLCGISYADWVVTDHYAIGEEWQSMIKSKLDCRLLAIDDLVRVHCADMIVDQTLNRTANEYHSPALVLTGTEFALLNGQFAKRRVQAEQRTFTECKLRVLVSMGGIDAPNTSLKVAKSLEAHIDCDCTILLSERSPHFKEVKAWCEDKPQFNHIAFTDDMPEMMLSHDIAIGAPGSTSWERACLGLPCVIVPLADNQHEICHQLVASGAAIKVELDEISNELPNAVNRLLEDWVQFSQKNLKLCDGLGAERVVEKIMEMNRENHPFM